MKIPIKLIIILCLIILLLPVFYMFISSFAELDTAFLGQVFSSARYLKLLSTSVLIAALTAVFSVIIGVPIAFIIARFRIPFSRTIEYLLLLPLLIPSYFITIAWLYLMGMNGVLTNYLKEIFQVASLPFTVYNIQGSIFILTLCHFPLVVFLTLSGLKNIDFNLEKTAWLTGSKLQAFLGVTLPLVMPYIIGSGIMVFVLAINNFDVPAITLVDVYPLEIFYQFSVFFRTDRAMILTLPLVVITLGAVLMWYGLFRNWPILSITSRWKTPERITVSWPVKLASLGFIGFVLMLAVAMPIIGLLINIKSPADIFSTFSIISEHLGNSFIAAASTTVGVLILGVLLAYLLERTNFRLKGLLIGLLILPLVIPGSAVGIGLIKLYNHTPLLFIYKSIFIVLLGLGVRFIVIPVLVFGNGLKMLDPSLENAARVSGAPWYRVWASVILPLTSRPLVVAAIICFILAINELAVTILVAPPGFITLSVRIYSLFHFNKAAEVSAMCLIMGALIILLYIVLASVIYKKE